MIETPTVLILGAGASKPYGFPTSKNFCKDVEIAIRNLEKEKRYYLYRKLKYKSLSIFDEFIGKLKYADPPSIDAFLDDQDKKFFPIGKIGIARALLPYEKPGEFLFQYSDNPNIEIYPGGHWYQILWWRLRDGCRELKYFGRNNLTIITFNYDRSLEYYLFTTLTRGFPDTTTWEEHEKLCKEQLDQGVKVIHIYGKLGELPWQTDDGSREVNYGTETTNCDLLIRCADNIKTISEARTDTQDSKFVEILNENGRIYFLGFGYHPENLEILGINKLRTGKEVGGTCKGLSLRRKKDFLSLLIEAGYPDREFVRSGQVTTLNDCFPEEYIYKFLDKVVVF